MCVKKMATFEKFANLSLTMFKSWLFYLLIFNLHSLLLMLVVAWKTSRALLYVLQQKERLFSSLYDDEVELFVISTLWSQPWNKIKLPKLLWSISAAAPELLTQISEKCIIHETHFFQIQCCHPDSDLRLAHCHHRTDNHPHDHCSLVPRTSVHHHTSTWTSQKEETKSNQICRIF